MESSNTRVFDTKPLLFKWASWGIIEGVQAVSRIDFDELPEDVIEDLRAVASEIEEETRARIRRKVKLPSSRDLAEVIAEAALQARGVPPEEFPNIVIRLLEERGFYTKYINEKRIWRVYESLVRRRVIPDTLGVVMW